MSKSEMSYQTHVGQAGRIVHDEGPATSTRNISESTDDQNHQHHAAPGDQKAATPTVVSQPSSRTSTDLKDDGDDDDEDWDLADLEQDQTICSSSENGQPATPLSGLSQAKVVLQQVGGKVQEFSNSSFQEKFETVKLAAAGVTVVGGGVTIAGALTTASAAPVTLGVAGAVLVA